MDFGYWGIDAPWGYVMMERPTCVDDEVLDEMVEYLDALRDEGQVNMFDSPRHLQQAYSDLTKNESYDIVNYWMESFAERHPSEEN